MVYVIGIAMMVVLMVLVDFIDYMMSRKDYDALYHIPYWDEEE